MAEESEEALQLVSRITATISPRCNEIPHRARLTSYLSLQSWSGSFDEEGKPHGQVPGMRKTDPAEPVQCQYF